jgi:hypothetical protein
MGINRINIKPATSKIPHPILEIDSNDATPMVNVTGPANNRKRGVRYVNVYWTEASDPPEFAKFCAQVEAVKNAKGEVEAYSVIQKTAERGWAGHEVEGDGEHGSVVRWYKSEEPGEEGWVGQLTLPRSRVDKGRGKNIFALALWHNHDWDASGPLAFFEAHPPEANSHKDPSSKGHHTVVIIEDDGGGA